MSNAAVWESVLSAVEKRINHESFTTWFRPITFMNSDPSTIYLKVPDRVFEDWILNNYRDVLEESLQEADLAGREINFEVASGKVEQVQERTRPEPSLNSGNDLALGEVQDQPAKSFKAEAPLATTTFVDIEPLELPLNSKYTFETFVV